MKREITNLKKNFKMLEAKVDNLEKIYQEVQPKMRKGQREAVPGKNYYTFYFVNTMSYFNKKKINLKVKN